MAGMDRRAFLATALAAAGVLAGRGKPPPKKPRNATVTPAPIRGRAMVASVSVHLSQGGAALDLPRVAWEGAAYWSQFDNADASGWGDPSFFPVSVFLSEAGHASTLAALGINTYMAVTHSSPYDLTVITDEGMFAMPQQQEWTPAQVGSVTGAVGWFISDECEMGYSGCDVNNVDPDDGQNEYRELAIQQGYVSTVRARNDGRFCWANFGNGILGTFWGPNVMDDHVQLMDGCSADKYTYTSPHVQDLVRTNAYWPGGSNRSDVAVAASYGWQVDRLRTYQDPDNLRPMWAFVETARPYLTEDGASTITPDQMEGAVWSALIHEARGIAYFQHNNDATYAGNYSLVDDAPTALTSKVTAISDKVASLASVLNSQSYVWDFDATGVDTMLKVHAGQAYVFAGIGVGGATGSKTFTLPSGITGTTVTVVDESRTINVSGGAFTDSFANEYTHHVYRVAL